MTKKSLLLATSAAAILFGGATAQAGTISGVTNVKLASELPDFASVTTSAAASQTTLDFTLASTSTGGFPNGSSLKFDLKLANAVFRSGSTVIVGTDSPTVAALSATATCSASVSSSIPTTDNATSATYFISLANCTASGTGLRVSVPVQATGAGNAAITTELTSSFGTTTYPVEGGAQTATFATLASAYTVGVTTTASTAKADVKKGYLEFESTPGVFGTVTVGVDSDVSLSLQTATPATNAAIDLVRVTASVSSGGFTGYTIVSNTTASSTGTTANAQTATFTYSASTFGTSATALTFQVADITSGAGNVVIPTTSITLSGAVTLKAPVAGSTSSASSAFAIVTRNGTNFVAPWLDLGTAGTSTYAQIRLANNGSEATGPVTLRLLSQIGTATATVTTVPVTASLIGNGQTLTSTGGIPVGKAISINGSRLMQAFYGTTTAAARNVDVEIAIEAEPVNISGKVRLVQPDGTVVETSLGNLADPAAPST